MICALCGFNAKRMHVHLRLKHTRPRVSKPLKELFGIPVKEVYDVIETRDPLCIPGDPDYIFPEKQTQSLLLGLRRERNNHVYLFGPSGTGKTALIVNVADQLNWPICRVNGDSFLTRANLVGKQGVKDGQTVFEHGPLPLALKHGWILLIDEYDTLNPIAANILKPMLEKYPRLVIPENNGEVVWGHPDFRAVATANTAGRGDDTGLFVNTHTQSLADLRRFSIFIEMEFPSQEEELRILMKRFEKELDQEDAKQFCQAAAKMRDAYRSGKLDRTFSPAETLNWVETYTEVGNVVNAALLSFLNPWPADSKIAIQEIISSIFGHGK